MGDTHLEALNELIGALQDQTTAIQNLVLSTTVKPTINVDCGGCGCGGGTDPPSEPGTEGGDPPPGFEEPTDEMGEPAPPGSPFYQTRKCKIANFIVDDLFLLLEKLDEGNVINYISISSGAFIAALSIIVGGVLTGPLGIIVGVLGVMASVAITFLTYEIDLPVFATLIDDNREDLVCSIYTASDATAAKDAMRTVLEDAEASTGMLALFDVIIIFKTLNYLFFQSQEDEALEAALETYEGPVDCGACGCPVTPQIGVETNNIGNTYTWSSEFGHVGSNPDNNWIQIDLSGCCRRITNVSAPGWTANTNGGLSNAGYRDCQGAWDNLPTAGQGGGGTPVSHLSNVCVGNFYAISDTPFSMTITFVDC